MHTMNKLIIHHFKQKKKKKKNKLHDIESLAILIIIRTNTWYTSFAPMHLQYLILSRDHASKHKLIAICRTDIYTVFIF